MGKGRMVLRATVGAAILTGTVLGADGGLIFTVVDAPWIDNTPNPWDVGKDRTIQITNTTETPWFIDGIRITIENAPGTILASYQDAGLFKSISEFDDLNGPNRYEFRLNDETDLLNVADPKSNLTPIKFFGKNCLANTDWAPKEPYHYLLKTGSFASDKGYIDAPYVEVDSIPIIISQPDFYDTDHHVLDTIGMRGGKWSGGIIDTWMDQTTLIPVTQFQLNFLPEDQFIKMNGEFCKFRPDLMGKGKSPDGAGPMYAMSMAMVQEYMHLDWQMLAAIGSHESMAALFTYENMGGAPGDPKEMAYGFRGAMGQNNSDQIGTMHYIQGSYKGYALESYPKFFPYNTTTGYEEFFNTPGTGGWCAGNSATIANAGLINSLYIWYGFELLFGSTDFDYRKILESAKDKEFATKMFMYAWNKGFNGGVAGPGLDEPAFKWKDQINIDEYVNDDDIIDKCPNYVNLVYQTLPKLVGANKNSVLNPTGNMDCEVYDAPISKEKLAEFFFGMNYSGDTKVGTSLDIARNGKLGIHGILQHFRQIDDDTRKIIWTDLEKAYDMMAGKSPSTLGSDEVSLRYDFITLLRIAKKYINIDKPTPASDYYLRWVKKHSTQNVIGHEAVDSLYPTYVVDYSDFGFNSAGDFYLHIDASDDDLFDLKRPVEWVIDKQWEVWDTGSVVSLDSIGTGDDKRYTARFKVVIPHAIYKKYFGDQKTGYGWVRVSDRSRNSTVQEFVIPAIKYPRFEKAYMRDLDGDGIGDSLVVKLIPAEDDDNFYELEGYETLDYAWPAKTPLKDKSQAERIKKVGDSLLAIIDRSLSGGAGEGAVHFQYPLDKAEFKIDTIMSKFSGDVADSVGPAIQFAKVVVTEPRDRDTVYLTVSEPVSNFDKENHLYCLLKKGTTVEKITAEKFEHVQNSKYKVIFAKNVLTDEDSIRFAFDVDPLEDAVGNKPASYNQWVPLTKDGGKVPEIAAASMLDTDGDGDGDSIAVTFNLGAHSDKYTTADISGGKYSWTGNSLSEVLINSDMVAVSDDKFSVMYDSPESKGEGKISLNFPEGIVLEAIINDKVGPALQSASLSIQDDGRLYDTLIVTLNEELTGFDKKDHDYIIFDSESGLTSVKEVLKVTEKSYKILFDKGSILDKKKVKLAFDSDPVLDTYGNKPMDINQWIPLEIIGGKEAMVSSAGVYDIDGDGRGDSVLVELSLGSAVDKYTAADITGGKYSWPGTTLAEVLATGDMLSVSDNKFSFYYDSDSTSGLGEIELSFPDNVDLTGELRDKVGPVIDEASCFQQDGGRERDTLLLKTSETLKDNFSNNKKYIILFEQKSDAEGDTINVESTVEESGEYRLIVAKSAVTYGDWIQFVFDSGIEDGAGNAPLAINQKVLINVKGGVLPIITEAVIYDVKGDLNRIDGNGDSIFVELSLADDPRALTVDSLKSVSYEWGGTSGSKDLDKLIRISDSRFAIIDETLTGGSGTGSVTLHFKSDFDPISAEVDDKIAPVISSATYYNWSRVKDTLVVTFSEAVKDGGSDKALLASDGKKITLKEQSVDGAKVVYSIEGGDDLAYGNSLWVKGDEEIIDLVTNEQATDDNIRVQINYFRVAEVEEVTYGEGENRPDGYIDEVILTFDSELDESVKDALLGAISLADERKFTKSEVLIDDEKAILLVSQDQNQVSANTATEDYDVVKLPYAEGSDTLACVASGEVSVSDELAPVILSARFTPAADENSDGKLMDELTVTYSEAVRKISRDEPFTLSDASDNHSEYTLTLEGDKSGRENVLYFSEYRNGMKLPGAGDSIWIDEDGDIEDESGNVQQKNTTPVVLTVGEYTRGFIVAVTPTPFDLATSEDSSVAVIRVLPDSRALPDNIRAQCVIYDKVGNVIRKVSTEEFGEIEDGTLSYEFIPKNANGRQLGEGSYAVQFLIETEGSKPATPRTFLFIKGIQPGQSTESDEESDE